MIKNPKKNYSLKGKPLSTKIAFVVICAFIFSLFIGSIGGLVYLFKSCSSKPFSVSAESIDNQTTTVVVSTCSVDVSSIDYYISDFVSMGSISNMTAVGSISRPFIIRSVSEGSIVTYYLDVYYYDFDLDRFILGSVDLTRYWQGGTLHVGFTNFSDFSIVTVDFDFGLSGGSSSLGLPATIVLNCPYDDSNYFTISITDVNGVEGVFSFSPGDINDSTYWETMLLTKNDLNISYSINPFDINYTARYGKEQYEEGFNNAMIESDRRFESVRQEAFDTGKAAGYNEAISKANDYSFYNLMDAITYAPLKVFISLFNFEFLGINLLSLVTFILSVVVVLGIIKFFL